MHASYVHSRLFWFNSMQIQVSGAMMASDERAQRAQERSSTMSKKKNADGTKSTITLSRRQGVQVKEWKGVAVATAANAADLPGVASQHAALVAVIDEIDKIFAEQATFRASKQMASQRLATLFSQGGKLATVLKVTAKQRYGHGNDKLVE